MQELNTFVWTGKRAVAYMGCAIALTPRQRDVLLLLCEGLPNKLISRRLSISDATVKSHVASVLRSLNASTRLEAVILAFRLGLVQAMEMKSEPDPQARMARNHSYAGRSMSDSVAA